MSLAFRSTAISGNLALIYLLLIIYVSLTPFSGWERPIEGPLAFFWQSWPRYSTRFDLFLNIFAYFPLGFFGHAFASRYLKRSRALLLCIVAGFLLSFALECMQSFLPLRIASNVDIATNSMGNAAGALLSAWFGKRTALKNACSHFVTEYFFLALAWTLAWRSLWYGCFRN